MHKNIMRLTISVSSNDYEKLAAFLTMHLTYGWQEELCGDKLQFIVYSEVKRVLDDLTWEIMQKFPEATFEFVDLENTDWLSSWKEFFTPVLCGKNYVVLPPWLEGEDYGNRYKIIIEPKSAFGTGHHASTALCLRALDSLLERGRLQAGQRFLDLGCGSGVLGIGAVLAGLKGVCLDIDLQACNNAKENAKLNGIKRALLIKEGSVDLMLEKRFDLIMANILSEPLIAMAPAIAKCLAKPACLILSGILTTQADEVARAYMKCSLPEPERLADGEWSALVWA